MTEAEWLRTFNAEQMFSHLTGQSWGRLLASYFIRVPRQPPVGPRKLFFLFEYAVRRHDPSHPCWAGVGQSEDGPPDHWIGDVGGDDGIQKYARRVVIGEKNNPVLASVIRCIFGNPFRPVAVDPSWRTSTVDALARQMYESRDFAPMPILADALQDAGCDQPEVLDHCRGAGPHVRGCWVVDLILGKE